MQVTYSNHFRLNLSKPVWGKKKTQHQTTQPSSATYSFLYESSFSRFISLSGISLNFPREKQMYDASNFEKVITQGSQYSRAIWHLRDSLLRLKEIKPKIAFLFFSL